MSAPTASATPVVHELQQNSEWRFEVAIGQKIDVKVRKLEETMPKQYLTGADPVRNR